MKVKEIMYGNEKHLTVYKTINEVIDISRLKETYHCDQIAIFVSGTKDAEETLREIVKASSDRGT